MRLNKFLAQAGISSRRGADLLIQSGRVAVNGAKIKKLGISIDEKKDEISVDGKRVRLPGKFVYILLNKPKGHLCTVKDSFGRPTVLDLVGKDKKVFPVGRLDLDTQGARNIRSHFENSVLIYVLPPSYRILERRLRARGTDDENTIKKRINRASHEIKECVWYDYIVINDDLERAVGEAQAIILAERCRTPRRTAFVKKLFDISFP